jgi:hypothetical protein
MVRDFFVRAVMELTKALDCEVRVVKLSGPELVEAMKECEGELKE